MYKILAMMTLVFSGIAFAAEEPALSVDQGVDKKTVCIACHNVDGNSTTPIWPKISGQPIKYFVEQMREFQKGQEGKRFDPSMFGMVQNLTEEDFTEMAEYYAAQTTTIGEVPEQWVSLGEKIYRGGIASSGVAACSACHSPHGLGNDPAGFPRLSGQHPDYVMAQLKKFQSGERTNDPNGMMQDIAKRLTEEQIEAIAHYVSGLY